MLSRRAFLRTSTFAIVTAPWCGEAESSAKVRRVVWFNLGSRNPVVENTLRDALRHRGWVDGQNLALEWVYAHGNAARLPQLAQEVVARNVDVIVSAGTTSIRAAKDATATIPIVMAGGGDPVGSGLVKSLQRPGENVTGVSLVGQELTEKTLALLKEATGARTAALILAAANPANAFFQQHTVAAGKKLGVDVTTYDIAGAHDIERTFAAINADAAYMLIDPLFFIYRDRIAGIALKRKLPLMAAERRYAESGFLLTYGSDFFDVLRGAASFVDRILRGAKPRDLPVEQPTRFDLVVNAKTAKALGVTLPPSLLLRADKVIE
jgi:putative tryptophan/tyrosine transport system substrate-binding protein